MESTKRIEQLERRVRALTAAFIVALAFLAIAGLGAQSGVPDSLRVRRLAVVDAQGTERILIAAPLPDPIVQGQQRERTGPISGIALFDQKGNERAGLATADVSPSGVFIGLDSERGQEMRLLVNPGGGGHLTLFDSEQNFARIGISGGRPTLVLREKGQTILEQPPAR